MSLRREYQIRAFGVGIVFAVVFLLLDLLPIWSWLNQLGAEIVPVLGVSVLKVGVVFYVTIRGVPSRGCAGLLVRTLLGFMMFALLFMFDLGLIPVWANAFGEPTVGRVVDLHIGGKGSRLVEYEVVSGPVVFRTQQQVSIDRFDELAQGEVLHVFAIGSPPLIAGLADDGGYMKYYWAMSTALAFAGLAAIGLFGKIGRVPSGTRA